MIDYTKVRSVKIPEGRATAITEEGLLLWSFARARYVSLGDSIAAGHTIDADWEKNYGEGSQYGKNGNTETVIVPGSYTDLIRNDLVAKYGDRVSAVSFARSGDTVADLMAKLNHDVVRQAIAKANYVTVCIGANDVLQPAMSRLEEYVEAGASALQNMTAAVDANLAILADDNNANSYTALFRKLSAINPNAKYVFTAIYNPYKYLWIDEGSNGFFGPVLNTIPDMSILGFDIDGLIKNGLLSTPAVETLYDRVNGLHAWAETNVTKLNTVLRNKISAYGQPNLILAETKALYDSFPDRPVSAQKHYNDLVSVEYTRGYDTMTMDWGRLYADKGGAASFWWDMANKYVSLSGLDINSFAADLVGQIIDKVIVPDVDPHPETYGHYVLKRSFTDALGWDSLDRRTVTYVANGGTGSMPIYTTVCVDGLPAFINLASNSYAPGATGYYFTGWNASANGGSTSYSAGQLVGVTSNMTMYAQWSNIYVVNVHHSEDSALHGSGDTGPMDCYALWIEGVEQADLGAFSNGSRVYNLPYGTNVGVIAQTEMGSARSYITVNDVKVAGNSSDARWGFTVTSHIDIHFQWNYWFDGVNPQSYWNCYITTY